MGTGPVEGLPVEGYIVGGLLAEGYIVEGYFFVDFLEDDDLDLEDFADFVISPPLPDLGDFGALEESFLKRVLKSPWSRPSETKGR